VGRAPSRSVHGNHDSPFLVKRAQVVIIDRSFYGPRIAHSTLPRKALPFRLEASTAMYSCCGSSMLLCCCSSAASPALVALLPLPSPASPPGARSAKRSGEGRRADPERACCASERSRATVRARPATRVWCARAGQRAESERASVRVSGLRGRRVVGVRKVLQGRGAGGGG
jgi:hypothetical protein